MCDAIVKTDDKQCDGTTINSAIVTTLMINSAIVQRLINSAIVQRLTAPLWQHWADDKQCDRTAINSAIVTLLMINRAIVQQLTAPLWQHWADKQCDHTTKRYCDNTELITNNENTKHLIDNAIATTLIITCSISNKIKNTYIIIESAERWVYWHNSDNKYKYMPDFKTLLINTKSTFTSNNNADDKQYCRPVILNNTSQSDLTLPASHTQYYQPVWLNTTSQSDLIPASLT
jgi:hypothetical protein